MKAQHVAQLAGPALAALTWWTATEWGAPDDMVRVLSAATWMLVWWVAEAVPLGVTSVLPLVLFPTLGVADVSATAAPYGSKFVFLFLGGFLIALALERWRFHRSSAGLRCTSWWPQEASPDGFLQDSWWPPRPSACGFPTRPRP